MDSQTPGAPAPTLPFAEPTSLGLFGLAVGCAALLPIAFGVKEALNPEGLRICAWFCLLFGGGCQFLAGMMSFANKNMLGGTLLTAFSFNWVMNWWALSELAQGKIPNGAIVLAVDGCFLLIFVVMTYAFGFFSKLLFAFLLDIDVLYVLRIARELTHAMATFALPIALATVVLMLLSLYIAFALVLVNAAGRPILPIPGPLFGKSAALGRFRRSRSTPEKTLVGNRSSVRPEGPPRVREAAEGASTTIRAQFVETTGGFLGVSTPGKKTL